MATGIRGESQADNDNAAQTGLRVQALNRRRALQMLGVLASAAAGAAALSATLPEKASATTGTLNYTSTDAFATMQAYDTGSGDAIFGSATGSNGLEGTTAVGHTSVNGPAGVVGWTNAPDGVGVIGQANGAGFIGVWGQAGNIGVEGDGGSIGVYASGGVYGVEGNSSSGSGVVGVSQSATNAGVRGVNLGGGPAIYGFNSAGVAVQGQSSSSSNTSPGVYGLNTGGGPAIVGFATGKGFGFSAVTQTGTGCFGGANGAGGTGMYAYSALGTALTAQAPGVGAYAGYFSGSVAVTGALTVMGAKSAAVRAADGRLRRMYSLESPESWFEDFGSGKLTGGTAMIQLEPGFAGVVKSDQYHVFVTPDGETEMLHVTAKTPSSFVVREGHGGASNTGFSYRIVAKRKDIAGARLEHVDEPPTLEAPAFPTLPAAPPTPGIPSGIPGHGSGH